MAQGKAWDKDKIIDDVLQPYLKLGYSIHRACELAGIPRSTVATWVHNDNELSQKIKSWQGLISAQARVNLENEIEMGDTETSKWWLERREKDDFSKKEVREHENKDLSEGVELLRKVVDDGKGKKTSEPVPDKQSTGGPVSGATANTGSDTVSG